MLKRAEERLSPEQALALLCHTDTAELMWRADRVRRQRHGDQVYFVHSLNINPTNVCENQCGLCAFWRDTEASDAYSLTLEDVTARLHRARGWVLKDLHVVGGLTSAQTLDYYQAFFREAKKVLPDTIIQGLTAVEIHWLAQQSTLTIEQTLHALKQAGLDAMPGGGAEIFAPRVRDIICPKKISGQAWLEIHRAAHQQGIRSNSTLLFGHIETPEEIIDHLTRLRDLQDETGGFLAFCPLPFHTGGTRLGVTHGPTGHDITRVVAVARLFLDNFSHVRVLANYLDRKLMQTLLLSGADDVGGTSMDERIAKAAGGSDNGLFSDPDEMADFIRALGLTPVLTNSLYHHVPEPGRETCTKTWPTSTEAILTQVRAGTRVTAEQAIELADHVPFHVLGQLAHQRRCDRVGSEYGTFTIDRNISFTNVCIVKCKFCAFCCNPGDTRAFVLDVDAIVKRVQEAVDLGATQVLLQGGLNPDLDLAWYERLLKTVKTYCPDIWLHCLSPAEILWLSQQAHLTVRDTILRLQAAGLDSLPGGGAEILVDAIRSQVSPAKLGTDEWFRVIRTAQELGLSTTATMVYGFGETTAQRVEHLMRVRDLQDETGGFRAFIPWSFQANKTQWSAPPQTGVDYLRMVALARLVLDNVPHIQAGWVTEGPDLAQLALRFGADDMGGVLMEESVVSATGVDFGMTVQQIKRLIRKAGFIPAQRNTLYDTLRTFDQDHDPVSSEAACS